jgi:hypothetical protein
MNVLVEGMAIARHPDANVKLGQIIHILAQPVPHNLQCALVGAITDPALLPTIALVLQAGPARIALHKYLIALHLAKMEHVQRPMFALAIYLGLVPIVHMLPVVAWDN